MIFHIYHFLVAVFGRVIHWKTMPHGNTNVTPACAAIVLLSVQGFGVVLETVAAPQFLLLFATLIRYVLHTNVIKRRVLPYGTTYNINCYPLLCHFDLYEILKQR